MDYSLFDRQDTAKPFALRYPYPLWTYVVPPVKEGDGVPFYKYDFTEPHLAAFLAANTVAVNDVFEVALLNKRIQFQALRIEILKASQGLLLAPSTNSGATFDTIDCGVIGVTTLLPFGGTLDNNSSLATSAFIVDNPDCIKFKIAAYGDGPANLSMRVDIIYSNTYSGLGATNENNFTPIG